MIQTDKIQSKMTRFYRKIALFLGLFAAISLAGCQKTPQETESSTTSQTTQITSTSQSSITTSQSTVESTAETNNEKTPDELIKAKAEAVNLDLATKDYTGTQTIEVNGNVPLFTSEELDISNGAWERYGALDQLNRATKAEAMLNQSIMPTSKRGDISSVSPTGWHNKEIKGGYLYNRSHLIGFALSGENANWQNLITGTRQLNSPGMLLYEMDIKSYLEADANHYVRYTVTPIFRGSELLARGVHLEAQSIGDDQIKFNVYIFNIQEGVTLNYADGTSVVSPEYEVAEETLDSQNTVNSESNDDVNQVIYITRSGEKYHSHPHGAGDFTKSNLARALSLGLKPCKVCYGD
ncbi:DNA/RNA non-specific endonuclease [Enterococcus sp. 2201sp1_2201st1_B8_2201SCRN_220225]|uniref:DNA/RNA non-specific endonuclease n=1 Tax=unclassified Enterococcus TaxID=2608891 RepID=UPI0034A1FB62